jgi:hypothetical protein
VFSEAAFYQIKQGDVIAWAEWGDVPLGETETGLKAGVTGPVIYDGFVVANLGIDAARLSVPVADSFWAILGDETETYTGSGIGTGYYAYTEYDPIGHTARTGTALELNNVHHLDGQKVRIFSTVISGVEAFLWGGGGVYTDGKGITISSSKIETDLDSTKGLGYTGTGDTAQVAIMLASAASGLDFDGSGNLEVTVDTTKGIDVDLSGANTGIGIKLADSSGLSFDGSGDLQVPIDSEHHSTYYNTSGELAVKLNTGTSTTGGLTYGDDSTGIGVNVDGTGVVIRGGQVATASQSDVEWYSIYLDCCTPPNLVMQVKRVGSDPTVLVTPVKFTMIPGTGLLLDVEEVG